MARLLVAIFVVILASSLFIRAVDPIVPLIAAGLNQTPERIALLSTVFALPYAMVQPLLGAAADMFGKTRLMTLCVGLMVVAAVIGAAAQDLPTLILSRALAGIGAGGTFPIAMAIVGDNVPIGQRQVAIGRLLAAAMLGNLLGATAAGLVGDLIGWRGVFASLVGLGLAGLLAALIGFRGGAKIAETRLPLRDLAGHYRGIFAHPLAKYCFGAVFVEGVLIFGLFPYMALLLHQAGETRAAIAGLVLAGFGLGGIIYALAVPKLLPWLGERKLMLSGGSIVALSLPVPALALGWPADLAALIAMGLGFYMLHGVLQIYATELAPAARGSAMSLHSFFFFLGQAAGPALYGLGLSQWGPLPALAAGAGVIFIVGAICAAVLRRDALASRRV